MQRRCVNHETYRKWITAEEIANALTHGIGTVLAIAAVILMFYHIARENGDLWHILSASVYGVSLILLYLMSTLYHSFLNFQKYVLYLNTGSFRHLSSDCRFLYAFSVDCAPPLIRAGGISRHMGSGCGRHCLALLQYPPFPYSGDTLLRGNGMDGCFSASRSAERTSPVCPSLADSRRAELYRGNCILSLERPSFPAYYMASFRAGRQCRPFLLHLPVCPAHAVRLI